MSEFDQTLDMRREALTSQLTALYARDRMDIQMFEDLVVRVNACSNLQELEVLVAAYPALSVSAAPARIPAEPQVIHAGMTNITREGRWLASGELHVQANMSTVVLDFMDYEDDPGLFVEMQLELGMSTLKIIVPRGFKVDDALDYNNMSTVKNRPKDSWNRDSCIRVTGSASMSTIKVIYR